MTTMLGDSITLDHCMEENKARTERNDCAVRAIATACQVPYDIVHVYLKALGFRKPGGLCSGWNVAGHEVIGLMGYKAFLVSSGEHKCKTISQLSRWLKKQPSDDVYMVTTRGHVATYRDGEWQDWLDASRRHRVYNVWLITKRDPVPSIGQIAKEKY